MKMATSARLALSRGCVFSTLHSQLTSLLQQLCKVFMGVFGFYVGKLRLGEVKQLALGYRASKRQSQVLNPINRPPAFGILPRTPHGLLLE